MGYEGHVVGTEDRARRARGTERAMELLVAAHVAVGGEVVSGGGTGTWDLNTWVSELQAGSYLLMDTAYTRLGLPFEQASWVQGTVISVDRDGGAVADVGLKALGMDHGDPTIEGAVVLLCSDEHVTFLPDGDGTRWRVGDPVRVWPAHVDPTVAYHDRFHVSIEERVVDIWPVDLRGW
jgi:D-serine deaminase-like pyridoxal phosphate-dependent protein